MDLNKGSQIRQIFKDDVLDIIAALEDIKTQSAPELKESVTNYDKTLDRIKTIFANKDWSEVKKDIEKSDAGKKQIKDYFNNNGSTGYANLLDKVTIYLTGDPETIAHSDLKDFSITLNRELDIHSVADIVKHELDNLNKNGLKESYEIEKKFYPSKEVLDSIIDQVTAQGGTEEEAEIIAYALAQSSYEHGNGAEYTFDLYENDITDTDDFLLNIDYYLRYDRDALELFKEYYSDALELVENLNKKVSQFNQLKESLSTAKYNKIQKLIKECLKEGMEVEITIPKKRK